MIEGQAPRFVSAAEITRNFGLWQDRAGQGPLIVTHHGRPRCVMLSADAYESLSGGSPVGAGPGERAAIEHALLAERIDAGFVALDGALRIAEANAVGAMMLGRPREALRGVALADALPALAGGPAEAQLRRTLRTGEDGRFLLPGSGAGRLRVHVFPWPGGLALTLQPEGEEDAAERATAESVALRRALAAHGGIAAARITVRGTIASAELGFAVLAGFAPERLIGVRLTDLLAIAARVAAAEAVERVLSGGDGEAIDSRMLVNGGDACAVRLALAPLADGFSVGGAMLVVTGAKA